MRVPESTLVGWQTPRQQRIAAWGRRGWLTLLAIFVLAGLLGLLGVRTSTATATGAGYSMSVEHPSIARAGLDVRWRVTVTHPGGFGDSLTLAVPGDYFEIYETQGFFPEPSAMVRDADTLFLTFDAPSGDTFVVDYDAYVQPASQVGRGGEVSVVDADRQPLVSVDIRTWLLP